LNKIKLTILIFVFVLLCLFAFSSKLDTVSGQTNQLQIGINDAHNWGTQEWVLVYVDNTSEIIGNFNSANPYYAQAIGVPLDINITDPYGQTTVIQSLTDGMGQVQVEWPITAQDIGSTWTLTIQAAEGYDAAPLTTTITISGQQATTTTPTPTDVTTPNPTDNNTPNTNSASSSTPWTTYALGGTAIGVLSAVAILGLLGSAAMMAGGASTWTIVSTLGGLIGEEHVAVLLGWASSLASNSITGPLIALVGKGLIGTAQNCVPVIKGALQGGINGASQLVQDVCKTLKKADQFLQNSAHQPQTPGYHPGYGQNGWYMPSGNQPTH
jgi:hypothetical protein